MSLFRTLSRTSPRSVRRTLAATGLLAFSSLTTPATALAKDDTASLEIVLKTIRSDNGTIRVSVYRDPATFRKEAQAIEKAEAPAKSGEMHLVIDNLLPGRYAVMAYHDENANQKLDLRFGMFPIEGYGLSNNPEVMGPPKFEDSAFELNADKTSISIDMRY